MIFATNVSNKWANEQKKEILGLRCGAVLYLVVVYQVENQVYVSVYGLVLSQLRFHSVQPVNKSLESICKLAGEQQGLFQLVLSAVQNKIFTVRLFSGRWNEIQRSLGEHPHLSTDFPQTVSHLSLSSLSMSSSFCLSSCREVLSFRARPVRVVVSYTECLLPRAFWNSCTMGEKKEK